MPVNSLIIWSDNTWQPVGTGALTLFLAGLLIYAFSRWRWHLTRGTTVEVQSITGGPYRNGVVARILTEDSPDGPVPRKHLLRALIVANLAFASYYISWRYLFSINWDFWPVSFALLAAETYSFISIWLFGFMLWRPKVRRNPPSFVPGAVVDVFITRYNEPVELVRETIRAAVAIRYPHNTHVLDDGNSPDMEEAALAEGAKYIVRSDDWAGHERHAKAGNINSALFQTQGEFILILDADQLPAPEILDETLGYFVDPKVALVQTPQWFYNVPKGDYLGSQAPLFYGPIQQGKDGWNAAFFCGTNAVLRREAFMQIGIRYYARDLLKRLNVVLDAGSSIVATAQRQSGAATDPEVHEALQGLRVSLGQARSRLSGGASAQEVTWELQRQAEALAKPIIEREMTRARAELSSILTDYDENVNQSLDPIKMDSETIRVLASREWSPLGALGSVRGLLQSIDLDVWQEAQPVMPMATISVTEDFATNMRLHAAGWRSVFHHKVLASGLAPEDLGSVIGQRLRWAQGTIQVLLRQNPLTMGGLSVAQRLSYFETMWSYMYGFAAVIYLAAGPLFLIFGVLPVRAYSSDFFIHLLPYLAVNQLFFAMVGYGLPTWRGQQYSLALFPTWIMAVVSSVRNVFFRTRLSFAVTSKTRVAGSDLRLLWPQLAVIVVLIIGALIGLGRLALGTSEDGVAIVTNVAWTCYNLAMLSVIIDVLARRSRVPAGLSDLGTATVGVAQAPGRIGGGRR
ncbi:MAG: glycosyltransferase [Chloroflexi bacterium]|nr:glycosyltransferase [Chloroflexota bacterium]